MATVAAEHGWERSERTSGVYRCAPAHAPPTPWQIAMSVAKVTRGSVGVLLLPSCGEPLRGTTLPQAPEPEGDFTLALRMQSWLGHVLDEPARVEVAPYMKPFFVERGALAIPMKAFGVDPIELFMVGWIAVATSALSFEGMRRLELTSSEQAMRVFDAHRQLLERQQR